MAGKKRPTRQEQQQRAVRILELLQAAYPDARCALEHRDAFELLIATILSAQCTDERVNQVTPTLFARYRGPKSFANAPPAELEKDIHSTGFYRNKARSIQAACKMILAEFDGAVPQTMEELIRLPGVARKTANVVLGVVFGRAEGIVVDTHVFRVSQRLDLASAQAPEKVEAELMALIPRDRWIAFSHQMIHHGRRICQARRPLCRLCTMEGECRSGDKVLGPLADKARKPAGT